jgi:hypothetical protein
MQGIELEVAWWDQDVVEYQIKCSNGSFSGETKIYSGHGDLLEAADTLRGFPAVAKESRTVELGTFEPSAAGGGIRMQLFGADSVGHVVVLVKLRADGCKTLGEAQSVCLYIAVEAGGIDSFVTQASSLGTRVGNKASRPMSDRTPNWLPRWLAGR